MNKSLTTEEKAEEIVKGIIEDISDRRGLRQEWESIDSDIQEEIKDSWKDIIRKYL